MSVAREISSRCLDQSPAPECGLSMYLLGVLSVFIITFTLGVPIIVSAPFPWGHVLGQRHMVWWSRLVLRFLRVRVVVEGLERLRPGETYLFVANHQSNLDIPALIGYLPFKFRIVAKKSLFSIPVFGWCMSALGFVPVERDNPRRAFRSMQQALDMLSGGMGMLLFAEGMRTPTGELQPFKPGAFYLAQHSRLPIVPLSVGGGYRLMPRHRLSVRPGTMHVVIGHPLAPEEYAGLRRTILMEQMREQIQSGLAKAERSGAART